MGENVLQLFMAVLISFSYAVIFNVHGRKILLIALGGALDWGVYLLVIFLTKSRIAAFFAATVATTLLSEIAARRMKTPVIVFLVPTLIPLLPGGDLFYTMQNLLFGRMDEFALYGQRVLAEAAAIAFGILLVTTFVQLVTRLSRLGRNASEQPAERRKG